MDVTILICTYNRAELLAETLDSLSKQQGANRYRWEVLVVDNNSTDDTRHVVETRQPSWPVPLRYLFEPAQGKSIALNSGIREAGGKIIAFTDDDVRVGPHWLEAAVQPLFSSPDVDYTGGPVRPIWGSEPPHWLNADGNLGGTIAVKDHGSASFIFESERKTPLGVNMAVRRELFDRVGGFNPDFGRRGNSLLGQEQAEFFYRSRRRGAHGLYVPAMSLEHHVPAARLTHRYFRRWWYWKGISQARLHHLHGETELGLDLRRVPRWFGVPRYLFRSLLTDAAGALRLLFQGRVADAVEREMMCWYAVGYVREALLRRQRRRLNTSDVPKASSLPRAELER